MSDDLIAVGRIGPTRGVRGEVFVEPWTDAPDERFAAGSVLQTDPAAAGPLTVESSSNAGGKQVVHFAGVTDRAGAEALRGVQLFIPAEERAALDDPDEFYDSELVGLRAVTVQGMELGVVRDVVHAAGAAYLVVRPGNRDQLIPFVAAIVPQVDIEGRIVTIDPPEGLFEL